MEGSGEAMEVEEESPTNPKAAKRFGLKNSIQTNFGDDYVFQIVAKDDWTSMAVSLSTNALKLYSPHTGQFIGECEGSHSGTINQISFRGPSSLSPHMLYSCSSDSTIRAWDTRSLQQVSCISAGTQQILETSSFNRLMLQVSCISAGTPQEVFSFSFGGATGDLLAAGCNSQVLFWDWRTNKQIASSEESHMDDVTQVLFIPGHQNKLISASVDGLICLYDTSGAIDDDEHLESVLNVGTSVGKVGFFGDRNQKLWCLTHIEAVSVWDWGESTMEANFEDARSLASGSWSMGDIDYFVDCHYSIEDDRLWMVGGTNAGSLGYFPICCPGSFRKPYIGSAEAVFLQGHAGIVRSVLPMPGKLGRVSKEGQGIFGWTGGEDGRLCCWLSEDLPDAHGSWISSTLVAKSQRKFTKKRHQPY